MSLSSIQKKEKITDQVLAQIKDAFMRGELKPGDRLPGASELAAKMGVGISSVREALKMLESLGAVEARQGEGTFVCNTLREGAANALAIQFMLLPQTAEYLAQFREIYETAYTHLAMANATPEDLAAVEAAVEALEEKVTVKSPEALVEAQDELDFHRSVLFCTHNPYIIKIGEVSLELFFEIVHARLAPLPIAEAAEDHRNIFSALKEKDCEKLRKVFKKSFPAWYARFMG
ncbi:MAG: GntR family transcriptional regulator [Spirochaetaceae bacterium]|jgi:GntR family transcriptional repressor for pyruvate dehydrogenase complex|nr:GntR family transcriptional regulator [Spirochaetaceae bacterium]